MIFTEVEKWDGNVAWTGDYRGTTVVLTYEGVSASWMVMLVDGWGPNIREYEMYEVFHTHTDATLAARREVDGWISAEEEWEERNIPDDPEPSWEDERRMDMGIDPFWAHG